MVRPAIGWQFRTRGDETKVWWDERWRPLIRERADFGGVFVNGEGWIMPIIQGNISTRKMKRLLEQAEVEFNSH